MFKKILLCTVLAAFSAAALAQTSGVSRNFENTSLAPPPKIESQTSTNEAYVGLGGTLGYGLTLGYAKALSSSLGLRAEWAGSPVISKSGLTEGVDYEAKLSNNRAGAFVDWRPFDGRFRLTGGLTFNDTKFQLNSKATGNSSATINNKKVDMTGSYYNLAIQLPKSTPFVGLGFGHHAREEKGFGFFSEFGLVLGKFKVESTTDLISKGLVTQADIDAQNKKTNDSLSKLSAIPSLNIGMSYNF